MSCFCSCYDTKTKENHQPKARKDAVLESSMLLGDCCCASGSKELINDAPSYCLWHKMSDRMLK